MKGLELSEKYYEAARPELAEKFPEVFPRLAAGLAGEGSECFGYDDEISRDHDFGPSFCIWLSDEDFDKYGRELAGWYASLPGAFLGFPARRAEKHGAGRVGVMRTSDFFRKFTGAAEPPESLRHWLRIPEHLLANAVNGKVFEDKSGEFTRIRNGFLKFYPDDIRIKKMANRALTMAQAGQYNYPRALKRGDNAAAFFALSDYIKAAISLAHLIARKYTPYYKWMYRSFQDIPGMEEYSTAMAEMVKYPADLENVRRIEEFCSYVIRYLTMTGMSDVRSSFLEPHAWALLDNIRSEELRRMSIFDAD
ncbi:MAG: DUF4037 domain-containing protein [Lachnospiraceae bacterium]|nr:DUF4037 domain-containing protein [Lachnospiraceae bacterium]